MWDYLCVKALLQKRITVKTVDRKSKSVRTGLVSNFVSLLSLLWIFFDISVIFFYFYVIFCWISLWNFLCVCMRLVSNFVSLLSLLLEMLAQSWPPTLLLSLMWPKPTLLTNSSQISNPGCMNPWFICIRDACIQASLLDPKPCMYVSMILDPDVCLYRVFLDALASLRSKLRVSDRPTDRSNSDC